MKTLCEKCHWGLVREVEVVHLKRTQDKWDRDPSTTQNVNKCILGNDYPGEVVTGCLKFSRDPKATMSYFDPEFDDYACKFGEGDKNEKV